LNVATLYYTDDDGDHDIQNPTGNDWKTAAGVAAGAGVYPGSAQADNVLFPSYAAAAPTVNVNQSANANGWINLTVEDGYTPGLGTREAPLYAKVAGTATWTFEGDDHGNIWMVTGTAALTVLNITKCKSGSELHFSFSHAPVTTHVTAGTVFFEPTLFGVATAGLVTLNISKQASGTQPTVYIGGAVTTLNVFGGKVYWLAGTITTLNMYAGEFRCEKSTTARTVTNSNCYGGTVDFSTGVPGRITLTNPIAYKDGEVRWDRGESLQRS
jgi:hypothetical protein